VVGTLDITYNINSLAELVYIFCISWNRYIFSCYKFDESEIENFSAVQCSDNKQTWQKINFIKNLIRQTAIKKKFWFIYIYIYTNNTIINVFVFEWTIAILQYYLNVVYNEKLCSKNKTNIYNLKKIYKVSIFKYKSSFKYINYMPKIIYIFFFH